MLWAAQLRAEWREPVEVLSAFADEPWALGLVSGGRGERGRWSYVAREPDAVLTVGPDDPRDPFRALSDLLGPQTPALAGGPPFQGGVAGLASYELADRVEALGLGRQAAWPDLMAARYPAVLAFDRQERQVLAIGRGASSDEADGRANAALAWLERPPRAAYREKLTGGLVNTDGEAYEAAVADMVGRIHAGEIFQANIARSWTGRLLAAARPFDLFARLIDQSAAPFAAYLRLPGLALVSNSPERFVQVREGVAETRPIKGTRPRGRTPTEDAALADELLASEKDRAENLMIVDLMRNDLARVCAPGSVRAPELFAVESFANVHHLVSTVVGRLVAGKDAIDLLASAFPPGSITGAPKVQAMKTIAALETPRGPYCGSLFWAGFDGGFDSSVLIRTAAFVEDADGWSLEARAGAGIVADSDPRAERLETEAKIAALARALEEPNL
jgi:para-aminobenzoate synthetase component 1